MEFMYFVVKCVTLIVISKFLFETIQVFLKGKFENEQKSKNDIEDDF